jgi:hypothetical protein
MTATEPKALCPSCGTAELTHGRTTCQSCAAVAHYAARAHPSRDYTAMTSARAGRPCLLCGSAPSGPGGILCPGCKNRLQG